MPRRPKTDAAVLLTALLIAGTGLALGALIGRRRPLTPPRPPPRPAGPGAGQRIGYRPLALKRRTGF